MEYLKMGLKLICTEHNKIIDLDDKDKLLEFLVDILIEILNEKSIPPLSIEITTEIINKTIAKLIEIVKEAPQGNPVFIDIKNIISKVLNK